MAKTKTIVMYEYSAYRLNNLGVISYGDGYSKVGRETPLPGMEQTYVTGCVPAYNLAGSLSAEAVIHAVTVTLSFWGGTGAYTAYAGIMSQSVRSKTYAQIYSAVSSAAQKWSLTTGGNTAIRITDPTEIANVLEYGMAVTPGSGGTWTYNVISSCAVEYSDPNEPPDVTVTAAPEILYTTDDIPISWSYSQSADLTQTAVDVELCNADGSLTYRLADKLPTAAQTATVNLRNITARLTEGEGWVLRVRAYAKNNTLVSAWSTSSAITLKNTDAVIVSPKNGENRLAASVIRLRWAKAAGDESTGTPYGFTVQYSETAGESWTDLLTKGTAQSDSAGWYLDAAANTFRHGTVLWRVMVWSTAYQYSSFVRGSFTAVVQASTSSVQCDGKPLPTLSWSSASQVAYQVRFDDYDSGAVYGEGKSHRVPYVYEDGLYAAQVRTQAATGEWSSWTPVQYVQISNVVPSVERFRLVIKKTAHAVTLTWDRDNAFAAYIVYRGGVPVHVSTDRQYIDVYGNGEQTYFVRGITADGYYRQSISGTLDTTPDVDCLYDIAGDRWIPLKYSAEPRQRQYTTRKQVSYRYYAGREKPVAYTEGFTERSGSFVCCTQDPAHAALVEALTGAEVICKSRDGTSIRGILESVHRVSGQVQDLSLTVTEIDWGEKVPYETA